MMLNYEESFHLVSMTVAEFRQFRKAKRTLVSAGLSHDAAAGILIRAGIDRRKFREEQRQFDANVKRDVAVDAYRAFADGR